MAREIKDIELQEVSLVDNAANKKKKFLFYKQENKPAKKLKKKINTGDSKMSEDIEKQLKEYFGESNEIDFEKAESDEMIIKALETVNEYKEDFPDDLKKAVGIIAVTKQNSISIEKTGAKFSKDTLEKLNKAIEALEALKSALPAVDKKSEVTKKVEELQKKITELEEKKEIDVEIEKKKEIDTELAKVLEALAKRIETVEKGTGIKKSVEGQDDNSDSGEKKLWPSISN